MWTPITRAQHNRDHLLFPSNLTDDEWQILAPLMPPPCRVGRRRSWEWRDVLDAIFYILRGGSPWRMLPKCFPPRQTVYRWFATWRDAGLNETINPARVRGIINAVPGYYPDFAPADFDGLQPWRGLRPCSPDGLPYLGRTAKYANLTLATGHAMMGMSLGPVTGSLVAEIISGVPPRIDLSLLSPDRHH